MGIKDYNKPKILMIGPLPPPVHGSAMMTQYIKDSKIINNTFNLDWVNLSTSRTMSEIGKKSPKKILRFLHSFFKTLYKLSTNKYDLCYLAITCHSKGFFKDAPFALLCKLFGQKIVIHQHNKGMSNDVHKPIYRFFLKSVYKNAKVILLSERLYQDISEIVDRSQVEICPNGIPATEIFPKKENPIPQLLFLSNLMKSKGVIVLLDACKILKEKGYHFTCNFVGSETKEIDASRFLKEVEKRGLNDYICFLGPKFGEEKYQCIANADIFVFPSFKECFPVVLLEAMQQGIACISTDVGGIPDIVENNVNGLIIESNNSRALANSIAYTIDNPKICKEFGTHGYQKFKDNYLIDKFEERIIEIARRVTVQ